MSQFVTVTIIYAEESGLINLFIITYFYGDLRVYVLLLVYETLFDCIIYIYLNMYI